MRITSLLPILFVILLFACSDKKPAKQQEVIEEVPPIVINEVLMSSQNCDPDSLTCTYVRIEFPEFTDSTKSALNKQIEQKIKAIVTGYFREDFIAGTLEHIAQEFIYDYEAFMVDFPTYEFGWYIIANAEITYESPGIVSLIIYSETFTGGAHPNSNTSYFVFDAKTNKELEINEIISDTTKFKLVVEKEFRKEKGLSDDQLLADAGFMLDDGNFQLPQNIGFTADSVIVHFNPYEIAPYSAGPTTLKISREALDDILSVEKP